MTKALICSTTTNVGPLSVMWKLFGDPDHYAYKFGNNRFADRLPIYMNILHLQEYDSFHSLSIDYNAHKVYYGNNKHGRIEYGVYVHNNNTKRYKIYRVPETNQVTKI